MPQVPRVVDLPPPTPEETLAWMQRLAADAQADPQLRLLVEGIVREVWPHDYLSEYAAIYNWVRVNVRYVRDPVTIEQVKTPQATLRTRTGDCVTGDSVVVLRDAAGYYRLRRVAELEDTWQDYEALSYNFDRREWEFKPIVAWACKGARPVFNVRLLNGYSFTCTPDHEVFTWHSRKKEWETEAVADVRFGSPYTLLCARQIPCLEKRPVDLLASEDGAWLAGAYVAEGWAETSKVCIARSGETQQDLRDRLQRLGIAHSFSKRTKSAYASILKESNEWKDLLRTRFGHRALVKHIDEDFLSAPLPLVEALLRGYAWGDSWTPEPNVPRASHPGHVCMHSTVSNALAEDIKFIQLLRGRPLNGSLVVNHGGLGKNPIWRLWEARGTRYDENPLSGLTNIGVRDVSPVEDAPVYDLTVEGNHNFVLSNGVLVHNCDDQAVLIAALVGLVGGKSRFVAGAFKHVNGYPVLEHVWCEAYEPRSKAWVVLDPVPGRRVQQMLGRVVDSLVAPGLG